MPSLSSVLSFNTSRKFNYTPVAVFVGGTSGIGQGMAEAFARHTNGRSSIYLIGRNKEAAQAILDSLPRPDDDEGSEAKYKREFIQCDVKLMKNVHTATKDILAREPKINYLVLSPGFLSMQGRTPTEEGIDEKLALHYYGRWRFTKDLVPALLKAKEDGEDASIMSVMAAGKGGKVNVDDLGLEKTYSVSTVGLVTPTYNDLMFESFSSRYPSLAFIHAYPGLVRTNIASSSNSKLINFGGLLMNTLFYPFSTGIQETGEYMWHAIYKARQGTNRAGSVGEDIGMKRYFGTPEEAEKLWEHTEKATRVPGEEE